MSRVQSPDHIKIQSAINRIIDWLEDRDVSIPDSIDRIQKSTPIDDAIKTGNKLFHIYNEYIKKHEPMRPTTVNKSVNTYLNIAIQREDEKSNDINRLSKRLGRAGLSGGTRRYNNYNSNVNNVIRGYSTLNGYRGTNAMKFPTNNVTKRGSYIPPRFSPIVENPKWRKPVMSNYNLNAQIRALPSNRYTRPYRTPSTMRNLLEQRRRERASKGTLRRAWFGGKQKGTRKRRS
jgi:hypothetical protein